MYCPKVNSAVKQRVCNLCGIYFTSIAAVKRCKAGKGFEEAEYDDEEGSDDEEEQRNNYMEVELVDGENECPALNIFELLQNPTFVEDDDEWIDSIWIIADLYLTMIIIHLIVL